MSKLEKWNAAIVTYSQKSIPYPKMTETVTQLEAFLASEEGVVALKLLETGRGEIIFCDDDYSDGEYVYCLDGRGLREKHWKKDSGDTIWDKEITAIRLVEEMIPQNNLRCSRDGIVSYIRDEINKIADRVLTQRRV